MYRTMWPKGRKTVGKLQKLHDALTSGRLHARGYRIHKNSQHVLIDIPKREWADLHLAPPYAYEAAQLIQKIEPWRSIQVDSADMKRLWRSEFEVNVWIFCIGWPLSMIVAAIWIYQLRRKVARIDRNRGKGAIRTFQEHNAVAVCHLCVMDETPHPSTKQISS